MTKKFVAIIAAALAIAVSACGSDNSGTNTTTPFSPANAGEGGEAGETSTPEAGSPSLTTGGSNAGTGGSDAGVGNEPNVGGDSATGGTSSGTTGGSDDGGTGNTGTGGSAPVGGSSPTTGGMNSTTGGTSTEGGSDDGGTGNEPGTGGTSTEGGAAPTTGGTSGEGGSDPVGGEGGATECVPSERPEPSTEMGTMGCSEWILHPFTVAYLQSGQCYCLAEDSCRCTAVNEAGFGVVFHWDGDDTTEEDLPADVNVHYITGDGNEMWASGERNGEPVAVRLMNDTWTVQVAGIPDGDGTGKAIEMSGGDLTWAVERSTIEAGPCQGLCQSITTTIMYAWEGSEWVASSDEITGTVEALWGSSRDDVCAVGFTGPAGDDTDALLVCSDGCSWVDHSNSIPADVTNLNDISGAGGELVIVGDVGNTGVRLTGDDLASWLRSDLPMNYAAYSVWSLGEGVTVAVGRRRDDLAPVSSLRSSGIWSNEDPLATPAYMTDVTKQGSKIVASSNLGMWERTCQ